MKFKSDLEHKKSLKMKAYKFYKKMQNKNIIVNFINYIYIYVIPYLNKSTRPCKYNPQKLRFEYSNQNKCKDIKNIRIAFICDEMTYKCFSNECETIFLTPSDWLTKLYDFNPDILFCESAWSGINEFRDCWRGRIYKNNNLKFENRKVLFQILDYCKRANIKTVFWNKEDPTFYNHKIYNFTDTAMHFDYIFTTAKECVNKYKQLGCDNVYVLMFGFSPKIFNPLGSGIKDDICIFAGSWYSDQPQRCKDMSNLLNLILKEKMDFKIYDRYYNSNNPVNVFPNEFKQYLNKGVSFTELNSIIKNARYAVNINTVTTSETMFARRVFETMACNTCIISNYSLGMERIFGDSVWFLNRDFDKSLIEEKCNRNVEVVFKSHTYKKRLEEILNVLEIEYKDSYDNLKIIYLNKDFNRCKNHFNSINHHKKEGFILNGSKLISLYDSQIRKIESTDNETGYFIILDLDTIDDYDFDLAIQHFTYVEEIAGIRKGANKYEYVIDNININTIFNIKLIKSIITNLNSDTKKYII